MTLESRTTRNRYIGNGSTKIFPFTFKVWKKDQVLVFVNNDTIDENVSSDCSVTITETGGTVTFPEAPAAGKVIVIRRNMPYIQEDDYINGSRFDGEEVEDRFDQDCAERQDLRYDISRCVKVPETSGMTANEFQQAFLQWLSMFEEIGDVTGASLVKATGTTAYRTLADHLANVVYVQDFGAVGDGVTDDSEAFQAAVDHACLTHKTLVVSGKYKVSNILISSYIDIEGGGTLYSDGTALIVHYSDENQFGGHVSGLRIYAKDTCIRIEYSRNFTIEKCVFVNFDNYGVYLDSGFEFMMSDCLFMQNEDNGRTLAQNTGIYINTSDASFFNISLIHIYLNIDNKGRNDFVNVHAWSTIKSITDGSIFCKTTSYSTFTECYIDTCRYGFWIGNNAHVSCVNLKTLYDERYFNDNITPVVFYFEAGSTLIATQTISISGGLLDCGNMVVDFTNEPDLPTQYRIKDVVGYFSRNRTTSGFTNLPQRTLDLTVSDGVTLERNSSFISNGVAHINIALNIDSSIFVHQDTDIIAITGLPNPVEQCFFIGGFHASNIWFTPTALSSCSIGANGKMYLKTPGAGYVCFDFTYPIIDSALL